jgi:hypothetical protein
MTFKKILGLVALTCLTIIGLYDRKGAYMDLR